MKKKTLCDDLNSVLSRVDNISRFHLMLQILSCPFRVAHRATFSLRLKKLVLMSARSTTSRTAPISTSAWTPLTLTWRLPSSSLRRNPRCQPLLQLPNRSSNNNIIMTFICPRMALTISSMETFRQSQLNQQPLCHNTIIIAQPPFGKSLDAT